MDNTVEINTFLATEKGFTGIFYNHTYNQTLNKDPIE